MKSIFLKELRNKPRRETKSTFTGGSHSLWSTKLHSVKMRKSKVWVCVVHVPFCVWILNFVLKVEAYREIYIGLTPRHQAPPFCC